MTKRNSIFYYITKTKDVLRFSSTFFFVLIVAEETFSNCFFPRKHKHRAAFNFVSFSMIKFHSGARHSPQVMRNDTELLIVRSNGDVMTASQSLTQECG